MRTPNEIEIPTPDATLLGSLDVDEDSSGIVIFAHGSGSSRHSVRNRAVAQYLRDNGSGTLLFDLLTAAEERIDNVTAELRFDIELLARRLVAVTDWLVRVRGTSLPLGYFGASTGAAAALIAAADTRHEIAAVVSRGGRPDLAMRALPAVTSPTLLLVGGLDTEVIELNRRAFERLQCPKRMIVIDGASHLFPEPGALEAVCAHAHRWFAEHFGSV